MFKVLLLCLSFGAFMMSAEIELTVAKFKGDRGGAFSFTFDDGWRGQVYNTLEIIDPIGIKGTFFKSLKF